MDLKDPTKYIDYKGYWISKSYLEVADSIENFEVRDDDVWVCSFPKTGTTWVQEMVWCIANDLDFEAAKKPLPARFPFLEARAWVLEQNIATHPEHITKSIEYLEKFPGPRFIKTHLPFHLLPRQLRTREKKSKIIYITRNPKDTCVSFYHFDQLFYGSVRTFGAFCKAFLEDKVFAAPFWDNVISYWKNIDDKNILFLKYEDMKKDLPSVIRKTATYLDRNLHEQQVKDLEAHLSFASMKNNEAVNFEYIRKTTKRDGSFMRKGETGQWKSAMTKELIEEFDQWTAEKLRNFEKLKEDL